MSNTPVTSQDAILPDATQIRAMMADMQQYTINGAVFLRANASGLQPLSRAQIEARTEDMASVKVVHAGRWLAHHLLHAYLPMDIIIPGRNGLVERQGLRNIYNSCYKPPTSSVPLAETTIQPVADVFGQGDAALHEELTATLGQSMPMTGMQLKDVYGARRPEVMKPSVPKAEPRAVSPITPLETYGALLRRALSELHMRPDLFVRQLKQHAPRIYMDEAKLKGFLRGNRMPTGETVVAIDQVLQHAAEAHRATHPHVDLEPLRAAATAITNEQPTVQL